MTEKIYKNILVDAMMHLGDLIHATSVIPLLKKLYPGCKVSFLVEPGLVGLFENIDGVEHVIPYSYKSKGDYLAVFKMGKELKKYNFDLSISLDPRTRLAAMMWIANIPTRVGSRSIFWNESGIERFFFTDYVEWGGYVCKEHPAAENFQKLISLVCQNKVKYVIIENKDRLVRFGFDLINELFKQHHTEIIVMSNVDNKSYEQELTDDLISIIHYYSMKSDSNRRKLNKAKEALKENIDD